MRIAHVHAGSASGARGRRRGYETAMERHGLGDHIRSVKRAFTEGGGFRRDAEPYRQWRFTHGRFRRK